MRLKIVQNIFASSKCFVQRIQPLGICLRLKSNHCNSTNEPPINFENLKTMEEIREKLQQMMGVSGKYEKEDRSWLIKYLPKTQEELPTRSMNDSFDTAKVPLNSDIMLQNRYTTANNGLRLGRLLEDMDTFAVWIVLKHINDPKRPADLPIPYAVVTLLVDDVFIEPERYPDKDLIFSGFVSYAGKTSMEVTLWLEQLQDNKLKRITKAYFVFVARDSTNTSSVLVNLLEPNGEKEKDVLQHSLKRNEERKRFREDSILNKEPTPEEEALIYNTFLKTVNEKEPMLGNKVLPPGSVWMNDTQIETNILCQPEDRNLHSTVFGGFLMRMATELAFLVSDVHCKKRALLKAINSITFRNPVPIGSRLILIGKICFTSDNVLVIEVLAKVDSAETKTSRTTNSFYHIFVAENNVAPVLPQNYHDAMLYLDGRRRYLDISKKISI